MKGLGRNVIYSICFGLLLIGCNTSTTTLPYKDNDESWEELNQKAVEYYQAYKFDEAIKYAQKALVLAEKEFGNNAIECAYKL